MSTARKIREKRLDLGCAGLLLSPAEFDAIRDSDERFRYELIRGVVVVSRLPSVAEGDPNEELGHLLRAYRDAFPGVSTLDTTLPERYVFLGGQRRRADRLIWAGLRRLPAIAKDIPTIAVEFVSKSKRLDLRLRGNEGRVPRARDRGILGDRPLPIHHDGLSQSARTPGRDGPGSPGRLSLAAPTGIRTPHRPVACGRRFLEANALSVSEH